MIMRIIKKATFILVGSVAIFIVVMSINSFWNWVYREASLWERHEDGLRSMVAELSIPKMECKSIEPTELDVKESDHEWAIIIYVRDVTGR